LERCLPKNLAKNFYFPKKPGKTAEPGKIECFRGNPAKVREEKNGL
jgi:hypothetical protein